MVVSRAVVTRTSRSILHRTSVGCQESKTKLWTARMEKIKVISSVQDSLTLQKELFCQIEMAAYDALPWWTNWQMLHRTICLLYVLNIVNLAWIYCLKDANKDTKLACTNKTVWAYETKIKRIGINTAVFQNILFQDPEYVIPRLAQQWDVVLYL